MQTHKKIPYKETELRRLLVRLIVVGSLAVALVPTPAAAQTWTTVQLNLVAAPARGRPANGESPNYRLLPGQVHWLPGPRVEYRIVNAPFVAAEHAVAQSEHTLDRYITTRQFRRDDDTRQVNPCTG